MSKVPVHDRHRADQPARSDLSTKRAALVTRAIDAVDRAHARVALVLHETRSRARAAAERGLDRAAAAIDGARERLKVADAKSADLVNRAQGAFGHVLERARPTAGAPN